MHGVDPAKKEVVERKDNKKPVILVFCDFYLPGYKSGGSMRTLVNTVDRLGDEFDFRIVTRDHDGKTDKTPYDDVRINEWNSVGQATVMYLSKDRITLKGVRRIIGQVDPDAIYSNSYFSTFTLLAVLLRKLGQIRNLPIIVAPEGEITLAGLKMKRAKKKSFINVTSKLGLYDNIIWKATSDLEADEVRRLKVKGAKIFVAPNMPPRSILPDYDQGEKPPKEPGKLHLVYLSRIHPVKNLTFLLECLKHVSGQVHLSIYGPVDAADAYIVDCQRAIDELPNNVSVRLNGGVEHQRVAETMLGFEFFVLPSITENFGHVFLEALAAGCPLIISDRTPWRDLADKGVGWDLPLENVEHWIEVLNRCVEMDADAYSQMSKQARIYAESWLANEEVERATRELIEFSLGSAFYESVS
jgi:glycosyltransferase involved in cell wall biosynthesis